MLIQLGFRLLLANVRSQEKETGLRLDKQCKIRDCLHYNISDQTVGLNGRTGRLLAKVQDYSRTRRGGLCVYNIDAYRIYELSFH